MTDVMFQPIKPYDLFNLQFAAQLASSYFSNIPLPSITTSHISILWPQYRFLRYFTLPQSYQIIQNCCIFLHYISFSRTLRLCYVLKQLSSSLQVQTNTVLLTNAVTTLLNISELSLNRQTNKCRLLIFIFSKTYLKFLKTLLYVSVIRPSSGSL